MSIDGQGGPEGGSLLPLLIGVFTSLVVQWLSWNRLCSLPKNGRGFFGVVLPLAGTLIALAVGNFSSHGGSIELDATGEGTNVTGSMTYTDLGGEDIGRFEVDLACTRTTDSGLIVIGGQVTDSTNVDESAPEGSNVAIVLQRGSPVKAVFWFEHPDPHEASCPAFLEGVPDAGDSGSEPSALEPIEGTIELRP